MTKKDFVIPYFALLCIMGLILYGPIPQDKNYHDFADNRKALGIPNILDVITNLPFAIIGLWGLWVVRHINYTELKRITIVLFTSFLLLTIGSGYYHLWPNNETLVYDRIPIVIIVVSFFAFIIHDFISVKKGYYAFIVLNIIGIITVIYWITSEHAGKGDLRWYAMMQFYPVIAIPLILLLYKSPFSYAKEVIPIFLFFGLARLSEKFDKEIYHFLNNIISGHSIKHLLMAAAGYEIVKLIRRRQKLIYPGNIQCS